VRKPEVAIGEADREDPADRITTTSNGAPTDAASLEQELDRVSLTQALIDTEAATARVIDLTERLVDARMQINALRKETDALRIEHHELRNEHEAMQQSAAFRLATSIWNIRNALRL
jgi:predicted ATP-grasp superfamily ATP-dependent carboligase